MSIAISFLPKQKLRISRVLARAMRDEILGNEYELSVAFVTRAEIQRYNRKFRRKPIPTDMLSFSLSSRSGEILFCLAEVKKQAPLFHHTPSNFLRFLLIHGLLHLKGYAHGSRMEREEERFRKKFSV